MQGSVNFSPQGYSSALPSQHGWFMLSKENDSGVGARKYKVLIISASPEKACFDQAIREINQGLVEHKSAENIHMVADYYASTSTMIDRLQAHKPDVVHFMGHMSQTGIVLVGKYPDKPFEVPSRGVVAMFKNEDFSSTVRCVLITGCQNSVLAGEIINNSPYVKHVIAPIYPVNSELAAQFSAIFYSSLAKGHGFVESSRLAAEATPITPPNS